MGGIREIRDEINLRAERAWLGVATAARDLRRASIELRVEVSERDAALPELDSEEIEDVCGLSCDMSGI